MELNTLLKDAGRSEEVAKVIEETLAFSEARAGSSSPSDRAALYRTQGRLLKDAGRFQEAEQAFQHAVELREKLDAESPDKAQFQWDLALALAELLQDEVVTTARPSASASTTQSDASSRSTGGAEANRPPPSGQSVMREWVDESGSNPIETNASRRRVVTPALWSCSGTARRLLVSA